MMLVLQDFFGVIVHRSFYTQPTIMGFHNHWNNPMVESQHEISQIFSPAFYHNIYIFLNRYILHIATKK